MVSKTRMLERVKAFDWKAVREGLTESPALVGFRDERGRNWLHLCCGVDVSKRKEGAADSVKTADVLLKAGHGVSQPAFTEGGFFEATPLWYAIGRGRNHDLARFLLKRGSNPNNCLWAASFNHDLEAIRLLIRGGADVDQDGPETPFLGAVKWSLFDAAEELLKHGADPNWQDAKKMTALHYMLKKGSDRKHVAMVISYGARGDIPNKEGVTAAEVMLRKKDSAFRAMAEKLAR
ncbi:MAG TPA: ankyrin repeat domain-containing protein [Pseudomonadales bacterium]|nr:ankyrin repeat domain-containing protein [Pseudomonadales bacterium]